MKVLKYICSFLLLFLLCGCGKGYDKLTYTTYNEYFSENEDYVILNKTSDYDLNIRKYYIAGNGDIQAIYIEFASVDDAIEYVEDLYVDEDNYKVKLKDDYSYVKNTKNQYFKLYRVDNVILNVIATDKENKKQVNTILKDLGY